MMTAESSWRLWVVKMDRRGRITLPAEVRQRLGVQPGDMLRLVEDAGRWRIEAMAM